LPIFPHLTTVDYCGTGMGPAPDIQGASYVPIHNRQ
jgi:hypothetical protein